NRQDTGLARYYYEMAVYMVPARLSSRLRLVNYYRNTGNWKKELYWLQQTLVMPDKIPSASTFAARDVMQKRYNELIQKQLPGNAPFSRHR
ncbi:MAG: hypothetical protein JNM68_04375, partial [Dinghuibacter sp.]|nr:hypothetical protein [Dinghuibacter sp.]